MHVHLLLERLRIDLTVTPLAFAVLAVVRLADPSTIARSPVGESFGAFTVCWHVCWLLGGVLFTAGRARRQPELQRIALPLLAGGWLAAAYAVVVAQGFDGYLLLYAVLLVWAYDAHRRLRRALPR